MTRVSQLLKLKVLQARSRGMRGYQIANAAAEILGRPLHESTLSQLMNDIRPCRKGDERVLAVARVVGCPAGEAFADAASRK